MKKPIFLSTCVLLSACGGGGDLAVTTDQTKTPEIQTPVVIAPPTPAAATLAGMTRLVWSDEFDVDGLPDDNKWDYDTEYNRTAWHNNEKQYYAKKRLENSKVQGGKLTITARKENLTTAADYNGQGFTSARLITRGKASWTYGFFEIRAKLPCSLGTWPAIWMLGTGGRWPQDGEIDIMEQKGIASSDKNQVLGTIHNYASINGLLSAGVKNGSQTTLNTACSAFHNYQLTWNAEKITIGINDVPYFEYTNPKTGDYNKWPYSNAQYLLLNIAMEGDLGGKAPTNYISDEMVVDYVRVYQK